MVKVVNREMKRKKKVADIGRSFLVMKLVLKAVLMNIAVCSNFFLGHYHGRTGRITFNWNPVKNPPADGELKIIKYGYSPKFEPSNEIEYWATIKFEADRKPEITKACFNFSGGSQSCIDVQAKDVTYTSHFHTPSTDSCSVGTKRINVTLNTFENGKTRRQIP